MAGEEGKQEKGREGKEKRRRGEERERDGEKGSGGGNAEREGDGKEGEGTEGGSDEEKWVGVRREKIVSKEGGIKGRQKTMREM